MKEGIDMKRKMLFDTEMEQTKFEEMYTFEEYSRWLAAHSFTSTLDNLKAYKNYCFNWVLENVWF